MLKAGLFLIGLPLLAFPLLRLVFVLPSPSANVVLPLALLLGIQLLSAVDAAKDASRLREVPRPAFARWYWCVAVWLLNGLVIVPAWGHVLFTSSIRAFRIPTGGMAQTILVGDRLLVDNAAYGVRFPWTEARLFHARAPARGEMITFLYPKDPRNIFLKRVIGLPGETVAINGRTVLIDGRPLAEPYAYFLTGQDGGADATDWGPEVVPPNSYFVLGDNRDNSKDSRYWGFLPADNVLGQARIVYYSWDARDGRVRWNRIGLTLR